MSKKPNSQESTPRDLKTRATEHWTQERTAKVTGGKKYPLLPATAPELLRELGLLNQDASMSADAVRKYGQINHLLLQLAPAMQALVNQHGTVRILDAGAGKSYLGFLLTWAFKTLWDKPCEILGVDHQEKLMTAAAARSERLDYQRSLQFAATSLANLDWEKNHNQVFPNSRAAHPQAKSLRPHAVLALHACDTTTDDALALGIRLKSDFIAVAPCCQAELAKIWKTLTQESALKEHPLAPVFHAPEIRRVVAADFTDMLRVLLLRSNGYEVTTTEFVSADHTPKNRLILASRRGNFLSSAAAEFSRLKAYLGSPVIALERLLGPNP